MYIWAYCCFFGSWRQCVHLGILLTRQPTSLSVLRGVQGKKGFYSTSRLSSSCPATWALRCSISISNGRGNVHGRQKCFIDFSGFLQQNDILRFRSHGHDLFYQQSNYWLATRPCSRDWTHDHGTPKGCVMWNGHHKQYNMKPWRIKLSMRSSFPLLNGNNTSELGQAGSWGTSKHHVQVTQNPIGLAPTASPPLFLCPYLWPHGEFPLLS